MPGSTISTCCSRRYALSINNTRVPSMSMQCIILAVLYVQDNLDTFAYFFIKKYTCIYKASFGKLRTRTFLLDP